MQKINLKIIHLEKEVFNTNCDMVVLPGSDGEIGILPKHSPIIITLTKGSIIVHESNKKSKILIESGFANICNDECKILASEYHIA